MNVRSARKWQRGTWPLETKQERQWRTRPDPFEGAWEEEIEPLLRDYPAGGLRATTFIEWLAEQDSSHFSPSHCRGYYKTGEHCIVRTERCTSPRNVRRGCRLLGNREAPRAQGHLAWIECQSSQRPILPAQDLSQPPRAMGGNSPRQYRHFGIYRQAYIFREAEERV